MRATNGTYAVVSPVARVVHNEGNQEFCPAPLRGRKCTVLLRQVGGAVYHKGVSDDGYDHVQTGHLHPLQEFPSMPFDLATLRACLKTPRGRVAADLGQSARRGHGAISAAISPRARNVPAPLFPSTYAAEAPNRRNPLGAGHFWPSPALTRAGKARFGDLPASSPWIWPKWPIARPLRVFKHALMKSNWERMRFCSDSWFWLHPARVKSGLTPRP
jgi:hypothetical protein